MTVIEFVDAVDVMLDAAIKWIMLGSAIASLLLLAAVAVVAWAAKRVRRGLSARLPASEVSSVPHEPDAPERAPAPPSRQSHEQIDRKAA